MNTFVDPKEILDKVRGKNAANGRHDRGREYPLSEPNSHDLEPASEPDTPLPPLKWLDMSRWDDEPVPEREWAIKDRVPLKQAGLFSGEGGTGKSIIELMKNVAHVAGKDWLGSMPEVGPAFYVGAEDDEREIHIRLAAIAAHYGVTFNELIKGGLHVMCLLGEDATLCAAGKGGRVQVTNLYRRLKKEAAAIKPKNISIDTLSRAFAGNEIDRVQVYAFAMYMQSLAMAAGGSVTVLSHYRASRRVRESQGQPPGTARSAFDNISRALNPKPASNPTATSASLSLRRTNMARPRSLSSFAISAACFCPSPVPAPSSGWRSNKRQSKYFSKNSAPLPAKGETSASNRMHRPMRQRSSQRNGRLSRSA
jgi:hypothetical protein